MYENELQIKTTLITNKVTFSKIEKFCWFLQGEFKFASLHGSLEKLDVSFIFIKTKYFQQSNDSLHSKLSYLTMLLWSPSIFKTTLKLICCVLKKKHLF